MRQTIDWVAESVQSLLAAAALADDRGHDDVFSRWGAVADQIRLVASGLDPVAVPGESRPWSSVNGCLTAALEALDRVTTLDGATDLALWEWHVREVHDLADWLEDLP